LILGEVLPGPERLVLGPSATNLVLFWSRALGVDQRNYLILIAHSRTYLVYFIGEDSVLRRGGGDVQLTVDWLVTARRARLLGAEGPGAVILRACVNHDM